jgi:hypothetical protein
VRPDSVVSKEKSSRAAMWALDLLEKEATGGDQLPLGRERRKAGGDQVGIDKRSAGRHLRQVLQRERRLTGAVRAGDDAADGRCRQRAHTSRVLPVGSSCIIT